MTVNEGESSIRVASSVLDTQRVTPASFDRSITDCINDLIGLLALPAMWSSYRPAEMASTLLDALVKMQDLDFAYMRLSDQIDGPPTEIVRSASCRDPAAQAQVLRQALAGVLAGDPSPPRRLPNPFGESELSTARYRLGVHAEIGTLVAGSRRPDFPTQTEALVLRVAANQAAICLLEARLVGEDKRSEEELERQVIEPANRLDAANPEMPNETIGRSRKMERSALEEKQAAELAAMTQLHEFSTRLLATTELQPLLEEVLAATIKLQNADFGNIQLYNPGTKVLEIVAHRGFRADFLEYFNRVDEDSAACGRALLRRERVVIEDVLTDPGFAPHRQIAASAGFRAVQSTPLYGRNGEPLGMLSTHFRRPHRPSLRELRLTDLYARQAAEMIERKRGEDALRESEARLQAILDYSPAMIFLKDLDGRYLLCNRQFEKIARVPCEAVVGKTDNELLLPPEQAATFRANDRAVLDAEAPLEFEEVSLQASGFHTSIVFKFPLRDADGKIYALGGIATDITERKRAEETLRNLEQELAHVARVMSVGELTASIAHEINQPLAAIVANGAAMLRWLERETPDLEEARGAAERIIRDGKRAGDVIRRVRALSQKRPPQRSRLDINEVIRDVLTVTQSEAERLEIALVAELSAPIPRVLGDHIELQQVVLNLILNGLDALAPVRGRPRALRIGSRSSTSEEVTVAVRDSGIGLESGTLDRLFDAFFTTKPGGLGLGLSISRRIIEAHGGRLWAAPNDDYGLTLTFTLPTRGESLS